MTIAVSPAAAAAIAFSVTALAVTPAAAAATGGTHFAATTTTARPRRRPRSGRRAPSIPTAGPFFSTTVGHNRLWMPLTVLACRWGLSRRPLVG